MTKRTALFAILLVVARPASAQLRIDPYILGPGRSPGVRPGPRDTIDPVRGRTGRHDSRDSERRPVADAVSRLSGADCRLAASAVCSGLAFPPDYAASGRVLRELHREHARQHRGRADSSDRAGNPLVADADDAIRSAMGRRAARSSRSRSRITTADTSRSVPTAISTWRSATADLATIRSQRAQNPASLLGKNAANRRATSADTNPERVRRARLTIRSSGDADCGAAGDLGIRPAEPVANSARRSALAARARWLIGDVGQTDMRRKWITSRPSAAAGTTAGATR